ncbi:hypothetical protein F5Y10DRAFT_293164 [Nemania abortiva]|nr:hypothetical protein F5Y10DRAFT_293164 [Nemania abortiva]
MSLPTATRPLVSRPQLNYAGELKDFSPWDDNKETLKRLYLKENCTLKTLKERMEVDHGFPTFKQVTDRKESRVFLGGIPQDPRKLQKEFRRNNTESEFQVLIQSCPSPLLPTDVSIRTPSPEPKSRVLDRAVSATHIGILSDRISAIRLNSPFNQFHVLLQGIVPDPNIPITTQFGSTNLSGSMTLSSSLAKSSDFSRLSLACYYLSNNLDEESRFTLLLLQWIGHSADVRLMERFFAIRSTTIMAVWDLLYNSSIRLKQRKAYVVLVNIGLAIKNGEWVVRRLCLIDAAKMEATDTVKRLLEFGKTSNPQITCFQSGSMMGYSPHSFDEYIIVCPLAAASVHCDLETMKVLLAYGANANLTDDQKDRGMLAPICGPLKSHFRPNNPPRLGRVLACIQLLLEAGASVDIDWPCNSPRGFPFYLTDYTWLYFRKEKQLVDIISQKSVRIQDHITLAGIFLSASRGLRSLQLYLAYRKCPNGDDREDLLRVALSEGAAHGLIFGVTCLLELGVDPNFYHLQKSRSPDDPRFQSWNPAHRASQVGNYRIVRLLKDMNASVQPFRTIRDFLHFYEGFSNLQLVQHKHWLITTALSLAGIFRNEIWSAGPSLIFASL